jgi:signal transduction histidine kinase
MELGATDTPTRTAGLRADGTTRITRLFFGSRTVIRKEPLGSGAEARLAHETAILERLRGAQGVAQLLDSPRYPGSIVLADAGGESLAELAKPFGGAELIELATELARAVASMHARGVIHRDIHPGNVVWSRDRGCCLVDFARATTLAEIRPQYAHHSEIVGALPYVAPEQTGRTGRSVDHRADLYGLGATLYEVATGSPPFGAGDPLRLIHDHLARLPAPPAERTPGVPPLVSEIVMHLLEKEPDKRYQTADGVLHDLIAARAAQRGDAPVAAVGTHDVPLRLLPPSRLVGRESEVSAVREAFRGALDGRCRGLLVSGSPGVGKTALVDELRPVVAAADGWFVTGKFDQYQRDLAFHAGYQAFRALGRLLLSEEDAELDRLRRRILEVVGPNAGLLAAVLPEFASLLGAIPGPSDPLTAQARAQRAAADALRAVATPERPLVLVMDDLQWGGRTPLGFIDLLLSERPIEGLLFVGAYREGALDPSHPLAAPLSRWSEQAAVSHLPLENLRRPALRDLVAESLRVDVTAAARLVDVIEPQTGGNPYETIELLNALRRDGLLVLTAGGWQWDEAAVRAHLGRSEVAELLGGRVAAMPPASRTLVESMACLGGRIELKVLEAACGLPERAVGDALVAALEEGLLVMDPGEREAVRFGHDRSRDAVLRRMDPQRRRDLQLDVARRLARVPDLFALAAGQYMPVVDAVMAVGERREVVGLLRRAAEQATLIGDHARVSGLMTAALELLDPQDTDVLVEVYTARHAARVSLGLFEEADADYREIEAVRRGALERPLATPLQVRSLTHRGRLADANELGLQALEECGIDVPSAGELPAMLDRQLETLFRWLGETDEADDLARPDVTDPRLLTASRLLDAMLAPTFFVGDLRMFAWVSLQALEIWAEHGPAATLTGTAGNAAFQFLAERGDYGAMYGAARRILGLGENRGYEPGTSHARNVFALVSCWFEPFESGIAQSRRALEGLIAGGDLANAGYTLHGLVAALLGCASLDELATAVEEGLAFEQRTGGEQAGRWLHEYQWLGGVLRGTFPRESGEAAALSRHAGNPLGLNHVHVTRAVAAAIFGDAESLDRHTRPLPSLAPSVVGWSVSALAHPLRALAVAWRLRETPDGDRADLLRELDSLLPWLVARAADAPDNFLHLLHLVEAELAWTRGDFQAAAANFDAALRDVLERERPWQRALITERAARFYLAHGLEHIGHDLLARAREHYRTWGATAKAEQLDWSHPVVRSGEPSTVTAGAIDLVGVLSASQALSSETSLERLHHRVVEVVSAMTGATAVRLLPWSDERSGWVMPPGGTPPADEGRAVPASVLRYVERTGEPLVVGDAVADERFARDPYFAGLDLCSLLAVPVHSRGRLRAVLLLENRLIRGAFSADRLDAIGLIVGQLAVSLDNAELYTSFRLIADEQAALRRVAVQVAQGASPGAVFDAVAAELGALLDAHGVSLCRFESSDELTVLAHHGPDAQRVPPGTRIRHDEASVSAAVRRTRRPARMDSYAGTGGQLGDLLRDLGFSSGVGAPIVVDGRMWGITIANWVGDTHAPADTEQRLAQFTQLLETAIANADGRDQLTASRARLLTEADEARRRVVRDLHDGAQQRLVHTIVTLKLAQRALDEDGDEVAPLVAEALEQAQQGNAELRELAHGVLPAAVTSGGIRAGVREVVKRLDLPVRASLPTARYATEIEASAYFIVAEGLTNVVKHSKASAAEVTVQAEGGVLHIEVRDNGMGGADPTGHGLVGMNDRVTALGGRLEIESPAGHGTRLLATLPLGR